MKNKRVIAIIAVVVATILIIAIAAMLVGGGESRSADVSGEGPSETNNSSERAQSSDAANGREEILPIENSSDGEEAEGSYASGGAEGGNDATSAGSSERSGADLSSDNNSNSNSNSGSSSNGSSGNQNGVPSENKKSPHETPILEL